MESETKATEVMTNPDTGKPAEVVLASEYARLAALLIDAFAMIALTMLIALILAPTGVLKSNGPILNGDGVASVIAELAIGFLVYLAINGRMLSTRGQTVGKRLMKVRIVDMNNEIPPLWKILFVRLLPIQVVATFGFVGSLLIIVDSLFIFRQDRRCIHDRLADTQVVKV